VEPQLQSLLTCPHCGHQALETMPANACIAFYDCKGCGETLTPLPGSCCVFCSYLRTGIWVTALAWMGVACILNARQCGRTHCRHTGPYYLAMIVPVMIVGAGFVPLALSGWLVLGALIIGGGYAIWWGTERACGKFSMPVS
jgi:hypothetical protein